MIRKKMKEMDLTIDNSTKGVDKKKLKNEKLVGHHRLLRNRGGGGKPIALEYSNSFMAGKKQVQGET